MVMNYINSSIFVYVCIFLFCGTNALVEIISPAEIAGVYEDAPVRVYPTTFDITAELILPSVAVCIQPIPDADNFTNRIVFIRNVEEICTPKLFARKVLEHDINTAGQIVACSGRSCSALGYLYTDDEKFDEGIYLPSLNVNDKNIIVQYLMRPDREKVIIRIKSTEYNPWLALGESSAGVFMQVFFELYALICLVVATLKLYVFIKFQSLRANITQSCLWIEIIVAIIRILFMVGPLSFGIQFMPKEVSIWFVDTPNVLSLVTTLLITFYWQEILSVISERLQNTLINRLSKFRWPFFLISLVVIFTHIFSTINSILFFITDVSGSTYTVTAIIALLVSFGSSVFFFVIGYRVFKVADRKTSVNGERKATRVTIFILSSAVAMMLRILGLIFYVSPIAASGRTAYFFTWWLVFLSSWTISFTKILAFEPPPSASRSFGSYFRKPTRFFKYVLNHYFGCHISTESDRMTQEMVTTSANEQGKDSGVYSKSEYEEESEN